MKKKKILKNENKKEQKNIFLDFFEDSNKNWYWTYVKHGIFFLLLLVLHTQERSISC